MRKKRLAPEQPAAHTTQIRVNNVRISPFRFGLVGTIGVLIALLLGTIVGQLATVLIYVGVALFLALGLDPVISFLERKLPRPAAVTVVVLSVLAAFAGILLAILPKIIEQIANLIENGPEMFNQIVSSDVYKQLTEQFGSSFEDAAEGVLSYVKDPGNLSQIGGGLLQVGTGIASGFTAITVVLILTLYFMASLRGMKKMAARFIPAYQRPGFSSLLEEVCEAVGRYVMGQGSLALINGVMSLIMLSIIQGPMPMLLALIAFIGSLIPMVGTLSASVIISLLCLFQSPQTALIAAIYYLIYMQVESYILNPRIMNKAVAIPGSVVVIAAVAGATLGSVLGALVAIPIAASILIIIQKVVFPAQDAKTTPPEEATA